MAVTQASLDTLNTLMQDTYRQLRLVLDALADGEELAWDKTGTVPIVAEAVGTGTGALGAALGEFALDWPVDDIADITSISSSIEGAWTPRALGGNTGVGNEVEVATGRGEASGDLQFFVAGVATDVANTSVITATYTPAKVEAADQGPRAIRIVASDLVGPGGVNASQLENMRGLLNPGHFSSADAV